MELEAYPQELERTKAQLLVFAREISSVYQEQRKQARRLTDLVQELRDEYLQVIQTLALVVEAKDEYTRYHLDRCRTYATQLAGRIDPDMVTPELEYGFLLHDVGKIGIPESILSKPGPLTPQEMKVMQTHPLVGVQLVSPMMRALNGSTIDVIKHHHERFDGKGYPDGLRGTHIPLPARVFSVVDAFDAMTTDRPYREALGVQEALERLVDGAGSQFDSDIVTVFIDLVETKAA